MNLNSLYFTLVDITTQYAKIGLMLFNFNDYIVL